MQLYILFYRLSVNHHIMNTGLLIALQMLLHYSNAAVYNYNESSEEIPYIYDDQFLSGFRDVINKDFIIGGLFPVYDCTGSRYGDLELLEAFLFAVDRINNDMSLLPNLIIGYDLRDTCNDTSLGLIESLDFYSNYVRPQRQGNFSNPVFLGVVGAANNSVTHPVASFLGLDVIQIPMVSYASSDATLSNKGIYKYLLRTIPSDNLQVNAMIDLVSYFGWEYVNVIFDDNEYGKSGSNAFVDAATERGICVDVKIGILLSEVSGANETIVKAISNLRNSKASVVVVFSNEDTVLSLFEELNNQTNGTLPKLVWIASDRWASAASVRDRFPEIARGMFGFQLHTDHVEEFADYFSQLTPNTNIRDPFFRMSIYYYLFCDFEGSGIDCPEDLTEDPSYSQGDVVPFVIDAVYTFAYALQDFLDDNCDSPLSWNRTTHRCVGMNITLTGENLLKYLYNVKFNGIQNHSVSFDENGDPLGAYEIISLQANESGQHEYVSVGLWNSAYKENTLMMLNNTGGIKKVISRCSEPCSEGMIRSITNPSCLSCFECIPCVGPTYSMNSKATNCSLCSDNHWGNNPLSGSTHCVPIEVQHLDFSSGWSIVSMCIASIALIILATITVVFVMTWNTPVVKSSGREQMVMLLIGIGTCCVLTYITVAPPSTVVCVFQRIGVWFCFSLAFGALLVKIVRVARMFYSIKSSAKRPRFTDPIHQVIFTIVIVSLQLLLVLIGLIVDHPVVKRDPEDIITSSGEQTGDAPEIVETCQQPHTAILVLLLAYNSAIIVGCTILGWMTRSFPENFNEAKHVMFTSFTLMVVWVLFVPLYFYTEDEFRAGVLALGIVLSAVALMAGIFFPRAFIIIFQKDKNTKEYAMKKSHSSFTGVTQGTNITAALQQSKAFII